MIFIFTVPWKWAPGNSQPFVLSYLYCYFVSMEDTESVKYIGFENRTRSEVLVGINRLTSKFRSKFPSIISVKQTTTKSLEILGMKRTTKNSSSFVAVNNLTTR